MTLMTIKSCRLKKDLDYLVKLMDQYPDMVISCHLTQIAAGEVDYNKSYPNAGQTLPKIGSSMKHQRRQNQSRRLPWRIKIIE